MRQVRKVRCLPVFLSLMFAAVYAVAFSLEGQAEEPSVTEARTVVARINGQPIYEDQLKSQVEKDLKTYRRYGRGKDTVELVKRLQAKALNKAIGDTLVNQEAKKHAVDNIEEKIDERVKTLEAKFEMERYLKLRRLTMEELRESLRARVRVDDYLKQQGVLEPEIPEERIREMYESSPESFSRKESVDVSHVLIKVAPHAGDAEKEQARQKAERIRKEILEGKEFAEAAKEHSDCNSAPKGGQLGPLQKGYMPAEFDEVAFALKKDVVSEVVKTKFGYHIITVTDKQPGGVIPFEEIKGFVKKYLQGEESKKKFASHVAELKEKAEIEILLK